MRRLATQASNTRHKHRMRLDENASSTIFDALLSPELDSESRSLYVKYLVDFYVSKTHMRVDCVGFLSGRLNQETYAITNLSFEEGQKLKNVLTKELDITVRHDSKN